MASTDAIPVPRKNTAFRFPLAFRKPSDSTLITTWTGMDSEVSLDGGSFADCTNEATEIGTSGTGYIDLTAAEMNADMVWLKVTITNTGSVTYVFAIYPESAGDYRVADTQKVDVETIKTQAVTCAAGVTVPSVIASTTNITAGTITTTTNLTNLPAITANWLTAAGLASDAVTEIQSGLATAANLATAITYIDTEIAAILEDTSTTIPAQIATLNNITAASVVTAMGTGTFLTAIPWNAAWDTEVQSETADAIIAAGLATQSSVDDLPTNAELATALAAADDAVLSAISGVQSDTNDIQTRIPAALEGGRIPAVLDSGALAQLDDIETAVDANTGYLTNLTSALSALAGKFTGITLLADWLRRAFRKDAGTAGMATAETEIQTGGTATFSGTTDNLEAIKDASGSGGSGGTSTIVTLQAVAGISPGVIVGPSEPLVIGDDYLTAMNRSVRVNLLDSAGDPAEVEFGTYALDDVGISIQLLLAKSGKPTTIADLVGTCTFFPAVGDVPPYLIVEFTRTETAKAVPGAYDMQAEAVWVDGKVVTFAPYGQLSFVRNIRRS